MSNFRLPVLVVQSRSRSGRKERSYMTVKAASVHVTFMKQTNLYLAGDYLVQKEGLTHSLIHRFETVPNSKKLQTTTEIEIK